MFSRDPQMTMYPWLLTMTHSGTDNLTDTKTLVTHRRTIVKFNETKHSLIPTFMRDVFAERNNQ